MKDDPVYPQNVAFSPYGDVASSWDSGLGGLTKREYFAAMAMQGILANLDGDELLPVMVEQNKQAYELVAEGAVNNADALINALQAQGGGE